MSLVNYSVPYAPYVPPPQVTPLLPPAPPAATRYLGPDFTGFGGAAAINSLLYDPPRQAARSAPAVPSRKQAQRARNPVKQAADPRDPYASYYPSARSPVSSQYLPTPTAPAKKQTRQKPLPVPVPPQPEERGDGSWPDRPPGYTRISNTFNSAPEPDSKTSLHAVIDFDDDFDDYSYEEEDLEPLPPGYQKTPRPQVTPIEGPIFVKNNSVPVVPLYSYPTVNNGSLVQIPGNQVFKRNSWLGLWPWPCISGSRHDITVANLVSFCRLNGFPSPMDILLICFILWTALSLALGLEIRGEVIRGVPCIKRFHQLFCPTAGNSYPTDRIERFIDDNKALMKRMYGEFEMSTEYGPPARETYGSKRGKRGLNDEDGPQPDPKDGESYFAKHRRSRQSFRNNQQGESGRVDACESKVEIVTPYWASNSAGKVRAIVNTQHFEQAIHQEVCSKTQTKRCNGDCGCEQKYKWHRLLAYDPDNDCKGIFMDWFLFPSCCVCRCAPLFSENNDNGPTSPAPANMNADANNN